MCPWAALALDVVWGVVEADAVVVVEVFVGVSRDGEKDDQVEVPGLQSMTRAWNESDREVHDLRGILEALTVTVRLADKLLFLEESCVDP